MSIFKKKYPKYKTHFDEKKGEIVLGENTPKKKKSTYKINKFNKYNIIYISMLMITIIPHVFTKYFNNDFTIRHTVHIDNRDFINNIEESENIKNITKVITQNCNNNKDCEIEKMYKYVTDIPYIANYSQKTKKPIEVISSNSGDCDERSFLMASMLKEQHYKAILVFCKYKNQDHVFIAINKTKTEKKTLTYIEIENKKYYIAETTWKNSYIGQYNEINANEYLGVYDIETKETIPLDKIKFIKNG